MSKILPGFLLCTAILTGCGGGGGGGGDGTAVIAQNQVPTVSVSGVTVFETETVTLTATAVDADGSITQYSWRQIDGILVDLGSANTANISFTAPAVASDQSLTFQVTVTDDKGATNNSNATVAVKFNQAPQIAIADGEAPENTEYALNATISDPDGSIGLIEWKQVDGVSVNLSGTDSSTLRFTTPTVEEDSALRFQVTATDNLGKASVKVLTLWVKDVNQAPEVSVESQEVFETQNVNLTAVSSDADGSIVKYSWTQTGGSAVNFSGGETASISLTAPAVTADEILSFKVTVTDNKGAIEEADATLKVKFNQLPVVTAANTEVNEQTSDSVTAAISDADGSIVSISWLQIAGPTVTVTGTDTATLGFTAPDVQQDTELQFKVTATDNLGKSSAATSTVTVKTTDVSYSIQGVVTDAPIANAVITTTIAGVTYTATANANGEYFLDIKLATDAGDELIILTATSPDSAAVLFHSILGNSADIGTAAGSDTTLTSTELFATNITNVTAAYYALVVHANNGVVPTTKAELSQAAWNIDGDFLLPFATAVKLVLDYSSENADLALPAGFETIAAWLADREAVLSYIRKVRNSAETTYNEALAAIEADEKLVNTQANAVDLIGRYYVERRQGTREISQLVLNNDYSGEWLEPDRSASFTWNKTEQGIELSFGSPGLLIKQVSTAYSTHLDSVLLKLSANTETAAQFSAEYTEVNYSNFGGIYESTSTNVYTGSFNALKSTAVKNAFDYFELNSNYALPYSGVDSEFSPEALISSQLVNTEVAKLRLTGDERSGTAYIETGYFSVPDTLNLTQKTYPWQLNDAGQIIISLSANEYIEVSLLAIKRYADNPVVSVKSVTNDHNRAITKVVGVKQNIFWNSNNVPGRYLVQSDDLELLQIFWMELNADNTALTVSGYDINKDEKLTVDEMTQMPGYWQFDENGNVQVRRYRSNETGRYCLANQWQPALEDECQLYNERTMQLYNLGEVDEKGQQDVSLILEHRFYDSYRRGGSTGYPQLEEDLMGYGSYYHIIWQKIDERPVVLD